MKNTTTTTTGTMDVVLAGLDADMATTLRRVRARADIRRATLKPYKAAIKHLDAELAGEHDAASIETESARLHGEIETRILLINTKRPITA